MDLMLRDGSFNKMAVIKKPNFSCSTGLYGASKNDFELVLSESDILSMGSIITYGTTEFGGVIKERIIDTETKTGKYYGKTFRGQMESSIVTPTSHATFTGTDYEIVSALFERSQLDYTIIPTGRVERQSVSVPLGSNLLKAVDLALSVFEEKMIIKVSTQGVEITLMPIIAEDYDESQVDLTIDENQMLPTALHAKGKKREGTSSDSYTYSIYYSAFVQPDGSIGSTRHFSGADAFEIWEEFSSEVNQTSEFHTLVIDRLKALRETKNTSEVKSKIEKADIGDKINVSVKKYGVRATQTVCEKILNFDGKNEEIIFNTGG